MDMMLEIFQGLKRSFKETRSCSIVRDLGQEFARGLKQEETRFILNTNQSIFISKNVYVTFVTFKITLVKINM